jgi:sterol desaturase/sphingolipid hydroxylase (fatty acid hydroxylase superfamily)
MAHFPINHDPEPIRLFKSNFLEFFSHIHPAVIVIIWLPVAVFFLVREALNRPANSSPLYIVLGFLLGLFLWTLAEYLLHRFVFHFRARSPAQERIIFLFHGVHHAQPQCKTRLVMPPVVSIPMAAIFYGLVTLIVSLILGQPHLVGPLTSGLLVGYLAYDLTHYATHHFPMRGKVMKYLKRYHMMHHYKTPDQRFGVSSPLWDIVFKTKPAS